MVEKSPKSSLVFSYTQVRHLPYDIKVNNTYRFLVLTGISVGMVSSKADLMAGIIALLPHKIAVLLLLSTMLLEIKSYSRLLHIIAFSSALPLGLGRN